MVSHLELLRRHEKLVLKYLCARLGRDRQDLEDVTQEIAYRLLKAHAVVDDPIRYLYTVARSAVCDYVSHKLRYDFILHDDDVLADHIHELEYPDVADLLELEQEAELHLAKVKKPEQHAMVVLHHAFDYSIDEAAKFLGLKYSNAEKCCMRGMKKCREQLVEESC